MKTKQEIWQMLSDLQWKRFTKTQLEKHLSKFFGKEMTLEDGTDDYEKELDYCFMTTTGDSNSTRSFVDIEIYYAKTRRKGYFIILESGILDYQP